MRTSLSSLSCLARTVSKSLVAAGIILGPQPVVVGITSISSETELDCGDAVYRLLELAWRATIVLYSRGLVLLEDLWEFVPILHDSKAFGLLSENLGHLVHLFWALLDTIDTNVGNAWDTSSHGSRSTRLAVFHSDGIGILDTKLLAGIVVDLWIRLARWWVERGSSRVDVLRLEESVKVALLEGSDNTRLSRGRDNRHWVSLALGPFQLLCDIWALDSLLAELGSDSVQLLGDVLLKLGIGQLEAVLLLQTLEHASEVVANEVLEESLSGVSLVDLLLCHEFVGEIGTCLEGQVLRLAQGVITVKENILDLQSGLSVSAFILSMDE